MRDFAKDAAATASRGGLFRVPARTNRFRRSVVLYMFGLACGMGGCVFLINFPTLQSQATWRDFVGSGSGAFRGNPTDVFRPLYMMVCVQMMRPAFRRCVAVVRH